MSDQNSSSPVDACAQVLSLAVHELRTPASVVGGYLRMLQRDGDPPLGARQKKMIDEAEKSCARLVALIAELSDLSKLDAGLIPLSQKALDLFPLLEDVARSVHEAEERDVRLALRGESSGAPILGDEARLRGAFEAIFRAILREQPAACTVVVDRRHDLSAGRSSAVVVIAEESRVASAYAAAEVVFDGKRGGMGLALPIARRVIDRHGGRIWAPRLEPERGAAIVLLPLSE